jgi:hypothetical protein
MPPEIKHGIMLHFKYLLYKHYSDLEVYFRIATNSEVFIFKIRGRALKPNDEK